MKTYKILQKCTKMYKIVQILSENQQFPTLSYIFLQFPTVFLWFPTFIISIRDIVQVAQIGPM